MIKTTRNTPSHLIRASAERLLDNLSETGNISRTDVKSLIYELQIHQVELEVQNEELQQTQLKLGDARDQYRELYDHAPVAYLTLDQQGIILKANLKAAELLGSVRKTLAGKALANYITAESQDDFYLHLQAVFSAEKKHSVEATLKKAPGRKEPETVIRLESICKVLTDSKTLYSHTALIDISVEKAAEEALLKVNRLLAEKVDKGSRELTIRRDEWAAILNTATDAIITINDRGDIETVNRAASAMFGYDEAELVGSPVAMLMPEPHASTHNEYIRRYLETGHSHILGQTTEMVGKRQDGSLFPVSLSVNRIDDELRFIGIIRDMTDRVKLEHQLLQSIEAERNRISRELHDNISQLLVGMAMQTQSLTDSFRQQGNRACASELSALGSGLAKAAQEVNVVVKDLAGLLLEENRLEDYFATLVGNCSVYSKAAITLDWQDGLLIENVQIGTQLFRIAQEALHNAIKHADATEIRISVAENAGVLMLSIVDNGSNGAMNNQQNLPLKKLTGMGVSNMKYRAHVLGATLTIDTDSHGTIVRCVLAGFEP